jgi:hypothetical protein
MQGMDLKDALELYNTSASLTNLYWSFFSTVVLALMGFLFTTRTDLRRWHRIWLCIIFLMIAGGNLFALINKTTLHEAVAQEVIVIAQKQPPASGALQKKLEKVSRPGAHGLHGTDWRVTAAFHVFFDIVVVVTILAVHPRRESAGQGIV